MEKHSIFQPSPPLQTRSKPEGFIWWRSLVFALLLIAATVAGAVVVGVAVMGAYGRDALVHPSARIAWVTQIVAYLLPVALLLFVLPWVARRPLGAIGLVRPTWRIVLFGVAGAVLMTLVVTALGTLEEQAFHIKVDQTAVEILKHASGIDAYGFAFMALAIAPFVEELAFRGFFFNAFERYLPTAAAVVISALLFGLVHWEPHNPWAVVPLFGSGIVLAALYARTRALTATMIAHALFNSVTVIALLASKK